MSASDGNDQRSAAMQAFGITEVLENILLNLDMRSILRAQRVSKEYKYTIDGSPKLQEALFLRQTSGDGTHLGYGGINSLVSTNDLNDRSTSLRYYMSSRDIACNIICYTGDGPQFAWISADLQFQPPIVPASSIKPSWHDMYLLQRPVGLMFPTIHLVTAAGNPVEGGVFDHEAEDYGCELEDLTMANICEKIIDETADRMLR